MKKIILFTSILIISLSAFSQAYEGKIEYDKKKQDAFMIDYPYPEEAVENALIKKMEQLGYKGKEEKGLFNKDKGFRVYKSAFVTDISSGSMDYVFKVESKGKKDKQQSVVYLVILGKDGANAKTIFDLRDVEKAKSFLNSLQPMMEEAYLEFQINGQKEVIAKAEKKLKQLKDDQDNLEKKIKKMQDDLKDNAKDQDNQQKDVENQKHILETMKAKRRLAA